MNFPLQPFFSWWRPSHYFSDPFSYCICWRYLSTPLLTDNQQQTISPSSFRQVLRPVNHGKVKNWNLSKPKASSMLSSVFYLPLEVCLKHLLHLIQIRLDSSFVLLFVCPVTFPVIPLPFWDLECAFYKCERLWLKEFEAVPCALWAKQGQDSLKAVCGLFWQLNLIRLLNCSITAALWVQLYAFDCR